MLIDRKHALATSPSRRWMLASLVGCATLLVAMAGSLGVSPVDADRPAGEPVEAEADAAVEEPAASELKDARPSARRGEGRSRRRADRAEKQEAANDTRTVTDCIVTLIADVQIPAQVEGTVEQMAVREGMSVEKGQVIARIDDSQAELRVEAAEAKLDQVKLLEIRLDGARREARQADRNRARVHELAQREVISESEVMSAELTASQASSRVMEAEQELEVANRVGKAEVRAAVGELGRTRINAPIDGIVIERYVDEGEWVKRGDPICRVIRMDWLRVEAMLKAEECDPGDLKPGQDVEIVVASRRAGGKHTTVPAKIVFVSPVMTTGTRYEVWAEFENPKQRGRWLIRPGVEATLIIKESKAEERGQPDSARLPAASQDSTYQWPPGSDSPGSDRFFTHWPTICDERVPPEDASESLRRFNAVLEFLKGLESGSPVDVASCRNCHVRSAESDGLSRRTAAESPDTFGLLENRSPGVSGG